MNDPSMPPEKPLVLGVDTDPVFRELVALCLSPLGYEVRMAPGLNGILPLNRQRLPALFLVSMHGLSEEEAGRIRESCDEHGSLPIYALILPGETIPDPPPFHLSGQLVKPLKPEDLLNCFLPEDPAPISGNLSTAPPDDPVSRPDPIPKPLRGFQDFIDEMDMDKLMIDDLTQSFLERGKVYIDDIPSLLKAHDGKGLDRVAHAMKGMAGNLRFDELMRLADRLRVFAKEESIEEMEQLVPRIEQEFAGIRVAHTGPWSQKT